MPIYSFQNKKTNKEYEIELKSSELEQYIKDHPEVNQTFKMNIGDPVRLGITKASNEFRQNVIERIKREHPHNTMSTKLTSSNISEI